MKPKSTKMFKLSSKKRVDWFHNVYKHIFEFHIRFKFVEKQKDS